MINAVRLVGLVSGNLKRITTKDNNVIVNFTLITSKTINNDERKQYHNIAVLNKNLTKDKSICDYITEGCLLYIEGSLETSKYQDKNGKDIYSTKIVVRDYEHILQICKKADNLKKEQEQEQEQEEYVF